MSPDFDSIHVKNFVLGDLSKSDAHRYFLELVKTLPENGRSIFPLDQRSFDEIFHLTGGRMLLIENYVNQATRSIALSKGLPTGNYVFVFHHIFLPKQFLASLTRVVSQ